MRDTYMRRALFSWLIVFALVVVACGGDDDTPQATTPAATAAVTSAAAPSDTSAPGTTSATADTSAPGTTTAPATTSATETPEPAMSGGTVVMAEVKAPATLDPTQTSETQSGFAWQLSYETLVLVAGGGTRIDPLLATDWTISDDGLVYSFNLREGVTFHNGEPFTADDVVFSFERLMSDGLPFAQALFPNLESVVETGPMSVDFIHSAPVASFLLQLGDPFVFGSGILNREAGEAGDPNLEMIGTGPFKMVSYDPLDSLVLERYEGYWGDPAKPDSVIIRYMPERTAQLIALVAGEIDIMVPDADIALNLEGRGDVTVLPLQGCDYGQVDFNNVGALRDVRVRRAIALAIDRQEIAEQAYLGLAQPMGYTSPCFGWSIPAEDLPYYTQDIEEAKRLLAEAGYADGLSIRFNHQAGVSTSSDRAQEVMQAQLAEVGIEVTIETNEFGVWLDQYLSALEVEEAGGPATYDLTTLHAGFRSNPTAVLRVREGRHGGGVPPGINEQYAAANVGSPEDYIDNINELVRRQVDQVFPGFKTVAFTIWVAFRSDQVTGVDIDGTLNRRFLFDVTEVG